MTSSYQKLWWKEALWGCFFPHTTFILAWTSVSLFLISGPDTPTWVAGGEDTGIMELQDWFHASGFGLPGKKLSSHPAVLLNNLLDTAHPHLCH